MTNNNTNRSIFKNEDFLLKSFSNFLSLNPALSTEQALIAFSQSFQSFSASLHNNAQLASRVMNQAIANL